jgi:hypothetical protein
VEPDPAAATRSALHPGRQGPGELIDHLFASHRLVNPANLPTVQTIRSLEPLPSIGDDPATRRNQPGSDHAAVVATFNL